MKVLISEKLEAGCAAILSQRGIEVDQRPGLSAAELQALIGQYEGLIVRSSTQVNEALLRAAPGSRWWAGPGPGWTTSTWRRPPGTG